MKTSNLQSMLGAIANRSIVLMAALVGLIAVNLVLALVILTKQEEVVIQPLAAMTPSEEMRITQNAANAAYKRSIGASFVAFVGNVTTKNIDATLQVVEPMTDHKIFEKLKSALVEYVTDLEKKRLLATYSFEEIIYDPALDKVFVFGSVNLAPALKSSKEKMSTEKVTFELGVAIEDFRPQVVYFDRYKGIPKDSKSGEGKPLWKKD